MLRITMELLCISRIKREKLKKAEALKRKVEMREALPVLSKEEIRKYRLPYHEAVLLELHEKGYTSSYEFLKQLLQYQDDLRAEHGPDTLVWSRPRLVDVREQLDRLQAGLKAAEEGHYSGSPTNEFDEMLKLAIYYWDGPEDWYWLAEQLLVQCVNISLGIKQDYGRREATIRYIFGQFLLLKQPDKKAAMEHLEIARALSTGKSWSAKKELNRKQETIFNEVSKLLFRALIDEAKEMMDYNFKEAAIICALARKRASDACDKAGEAEALKMQGICEMSSGDEKAAAISFFRALTIQLYRKDPEGICEARINLALAYLKCGRSHEAFNQLNMLMDFAGENDLVFYIGQAHRYLGEFYLNQGQPSFATPLLIKALNIFHNIGQIMQREQARNLAAIAAGQELLPKYVDLILKCDKEDHEIHHNEHVFRLIKWKDTRELFWSEPSEESIQIDFSFEDALKLSGTEGSSLEKVLPEMTEKISSEKVSKEVCFEGNEEIVTVSSVSDLLDVHEQQDKQQQTHENS